MYRLLRQENLIHNHFASTRRAQKISIKTRTNGQIMQIRPSVGFTAPHVRPQSWWLSPMSSCHFNYVQIAAARKPNTQPLCKHPPCTKALNQNKNKWADHANQTICWIYCSACAPSVMLAKLIPRVCSFAWFIFDTEKSTLLVSK